MNILYTITSYPPSMGGAQLYLHEISKKIITHHDIKVVSFFNTNRTDWLLGTTLRAPILEDKYIYEGVPVSRIFFTNREKFKMLPNVATYYFNKAFNINALAAFIEEKLPVRGNKIDLIHNVRVGREPLSYASYYLALKLKIPFVFTPLHHLRWSHWFFKEYHELYRKADGLFALTPYEKEIYKGLGVKEDRVFITGTGPVISDSPDPQGFRDKFNIPGKIVLFVGQGYKYKGISELIKSATIVLNKHQDVSFIFIGPHTGYSRKLFRKYRNKRVIHLGNVDLQTKTDALAACDIFCLPSCQESFGAVFLEAWAFGKPVIGADIPQVRHLVKDGVNGCLVKPIPELIAQKITELLDNPDVARNMGISGSELVKNNFTWSALSEKTISAYEQILKKQI
jgi:glycosyltransferase involved in cell wall biosynthesis